MVRWTKDVVVDPHDPSTDRSQHPADLAIATSDVEDRPGIAELRGREREDLLFVFGVGARREPVDPPLGVVFPQIPRRISLRLVRHGVAP